MLFFTEFVDAVSVGLTCLQKRNSPSKSLLPTATVMIVAVNQGILKENLNEICQATFKNEHLK